MRMVVPVLSITLTRFQDFSGLENMILKCKDFPGLAACGN